MEYEDIGVNDYVGIKGSPNRYRVLDIAWKPSSQESLYIYHLINVLTGEHSTIDHRYICKKPLPEIVEVSLDWTNEGF